MKRNYFLMLLALAFLLFSCRSEFGNEETLKTSSVGKKNQQALKLKDVPGMLNFLQSHPKIFSKNYGVAVDGSEEIRQIETKEKISYSLKISSPKDSVFYLCCLFL
ncbi:hypothetical protein [uncultured Chryseobacterium sp.]|uniref:hypothetical protein n=1 Tax=uncultured Chryseobacterium sp. TaxID=259322 RepID=UPI0025E60A30|nr:hypothetical protein [uncultured Chryseobacterium sp.]